MFCPKKNPVSLKNLEKLLDKSKKEYREKRLESGFIKGLEAIETWKESGMEIHKNKNYQRLILNYIRSVNAPFSNKKILLEEYRVF